MCQRASPSLHQFQYLNNPNTPLLFDSPASKRNVAIKFQNTCIYRTMRCRYRRVHGFRCDDNVSCDKCRCSGAESTPCSANRRCRGRGVLDVFDAAAVPPLLPLLVTPRPLKVPLVLLRLLRHGQPLGAAGCGRPVLDKARDTNRLR